MEYLSSRGRFRRILFNLMPYLFTSEVFPKATHMKCACQISECTDDISCFVMAQAKVACETLVTTGQQGSCRRSKNRGAYPRVQEIARAVIRRLGYPKSYTCVSDACGCFQPIHEQSADITQVLIKSIKKTQGAGDH